MTKGTVLRGSPSRTVGLAGDLGAQTDAISQRLADHVMNRLTTLADVSAPRLVDQAARSIQDVARTALWVGALSLVIVLGLPFAAGLVLGRLLGARRQA